MKSAHSTFHFASLYTVVSLVLTSACGQDDGSGSASNDQSDTGNVTFNGSVVSAFSITVDGVAYEDSEDFYTQEVTRLPDKVAAAGYAGWQASFDAVLGFSDLAHDMMVYIAPTEKRGYSGQSSVDRDASFRVELPAEAQDSSYNVRAVKRVNLILHKDGETKRFCYNFSAVDKNVAFNEQDKPIILDTFVSKLTLYSCENRQTDGIVIPPAE